MYVYHILSCNQLIFSHQVFLTATKKICQNKVLLIHQVIPIIDIVSKALDEFIDDATLPPAICSAAVYGSQHNIVPQEEILAMFKNKGKQLRKGKDKDIG